MLSAAGRSCGFTRAACHAFRAFRGIASQAAVARQSQVPAGCQAVAALRSGPLSRGSHHKAGGIAPSSQGSPPPAPSSAEEPLRRPPRRRRRTISPRPESEHPDDRAQELYLSRPEKGGYARTNFVCAKKGAILQDAYEFTGHLGKGGMGDVLSAMHRETGEAVAVKIVPRSRVEDAEALRRELEFLKVTDHPNVVRLYETYEDEENLYLVMEFCEGGDLWSHMNQKHEAGESFDERELAHTARQMLRALAYVHAQNIVHRDLKPSNFVRGSHSLKLVDFGVSGVVPSSQPSARRLKVRTGTDGYMAPEILQSRHYGPSADIFSLGATLYTMVTGKTLKWLESVGMYHIPVDDRLDELSAEGWRMLCRMMSRDPKARPTASECLQDPWLRVHCEDQCAAVSSPSSLPPNGAGYVSAGLIKRLRRFSRRSKLQRCARASMAAFSRMQGPEVHALQNAFFALDRDNSGSIDVAELAAALCITETEAAALLSGADTSGRGSVSYSEWLAATSPAAYFGDLEGALRAFDTLDRDGDGLITVEDLEKVFPGVFSKEELAEELRRYDFDGDGFLDFDEFRSMLREKSKTSCELPQL